MKTFECRDIYKDCDFKTQGKDEKEVLERAARHGSEKHGIKEMTPDLADKVRSKIRDVPSTKAA